MLPLPPFQQWNAAEARGTPSAEFYRLDGNILVRFPGVADFVVSTGATHVRCVPATDHDDRWRGVYEHQMLPLLFSARGEQIFHGAAVVVQDQAIAIIGPSGLGKSTLTTALARRGHPFMGDDCLHLAMGEHGAALVQPQAANIRLWQDSVDEMTPAGARVAMSAGSPKPRLQAGDALPHCKQPLHLGRCYVLGDGSTDGVHLGAMSPMQKVMAWTANAFVLDIKAPDVLKRNMQTATRLARDIPMRTLDYPRRYDSIESVVDALIQDVLRGEP